MTTPLSERDFIQLNAYLDGEMPVEERAAFERRLEQDETLRFEYESLRSTVALLKMAERVPVPRHFTLDPAVYGRPARQSFWDRLGLPQVSITLPVTAGATLAAALICIGVLLFSNIGVGGRSMNVAMEPDAAEIQEEAASMPQAEADAAEEEAPLDEQRDADMEVEATLPPEEQEDEAMLAVPATSTATAPPAPASTTPTPLATQEPSGGGADMTADAEEPAEEPAAGDGESESSEGEALPTPEEDDGYSAEEAAVPTIGADQPTAPVQGEQSVEGPEEEGQQTEEALPLRTILLVAASGVALLSIIILVTWFVMRTRRQS